MLAMSKKSVLLTSIVLLLAAASISHAAAVNWTNNNGTGDNHWSTPTNWDLGYVPYVDQFNYSTHTDDAQIIKAGSDAVIYDATDNNGGSPRYIFFVPIGVGAGVSGEMYMNGGSLYVAYIVTFNKTGNTSSNSKLHITGGLLHIGPWPGYTGTSQGTLGIGRAGTADCTMTGGRVECVNFKIPETGTGTGTFELNGGVVSVSGTTGIGTGLVIGASGTGTLNISGGKLILAGDARTTVNGYITGNKIKAYPGSAGRAIVNVDYGNLSDANTTVTASLTTLTQAWKPQPVDTNPKVSITPVLAWTKGDGAVSHSVYFGTSSSDVANGVVTPVNTADVNNYSPGSLNYGQTYYWRVDEFDGSNTYTGVVWSFTVQSSPLASNPNPADGATGVSQSATLGWTAGVGAVSSDVYFGISYSDVRDATSYSVLPGRGRQTATSYNPGTLASGQTYYWRIDEYDGSVVHTGSIWSFTTTPPAAQAVTPPYLGDLIGNGDGVVTFDDLSLIASNWLYNDCNNRVVEDLDLDCNVDFADYALLAKDWLKTPPTYKGNTYYVATTGSDSNPGTSSSPWATIQKAASVMAAGDTVIVSPGTYNGQVTVANSGISEDFGLAHKPITFRADPSGDVIVNANDSVNNNGFYVVGKAYITIDGFKITGGRDGIFFDGDGSTYDVIRNCQIYGNGRDGIRIYQADKVTIAKCLLYGNTEAGVKTADDANSLLVNKCGIYGNNEGLDLNGSSDVNDCIITNNTTYGVQGDTGQVVTYCDVWNNGTNYNGGTSAGTGCVSADPLFVSPPTDFHLLAGSPCIASATDGNNMGYKYPPIANAGSDKTVYVNKSVAFDGSASRGSIVSYSWNFGDTGTGSGSTATHTYTSTGTFKVSLTVNDGTATDVGTCTIEVLSAQPTEMVYHVTNLNSSGAGSFANCLSRANLDGVASRIVFDVGGTIYSNNAFTVSDDNTTISGTEAPSPGITFNFNHQAGNGFVLSGNNCRLCNVALTNTQTNCDGVELFGDNDVVERCTFTYCRDEGISVMRGQGQVVAFNRIELCGSQPSDIVADPGQSNGRGISVWYGGKYAPFESTEVIVVGNYIGDCLRGVLCGDYGIVGYDDFMDFRNNLVTLNHQTFGLNIADPGHVNIIDNVIINNNGVGIKYLDGADFYRSGNILSGNSGGDEAFSGTTTEVFSLMTRSTTPYPNWLKNVITPTDKTQVGMGSGPCQCELSRHAGQ